MIGWLCAVIAILEAENISRGSFSLWGMCDFSIVNFLSFFFRNNNKKDETNVFFPRNVMVPLLDSATLTLNMLDLPQISISVSFRGLVVLLAYFFFSVAIGEIFYFSALLLAQRSCNLSAFHTT